MGRLLASTLALSVLCITASCGREAPKKRGRPTSGRWHRAPDSAGTAQTPEGQQEIHRLESLGYLSGSQPAQAEIGVIVHDKARAFAGANLYTSGHAAEAMLVAMDGTPLHRWRYSFEQAFADVLPEMRTYRGAAHWRRVHLFPNGDLLAVFEGIGIIKIDKDSKLIWRRQNRAHHDLSVTPDGHIFVLTRDASIRPDIHPKDPTLEDFVDLLDKDGKELGRISVLDAWKESPFVRYPLQRKSGDILHSNTIEWLDGSFADRDPAFRRGNLLISVRNANWIGVIDFDKGQFVWMRVPTQAMDRELRWRGQHQPTMLADGHMLLFDNRGAPRGSRVLECDPWRSALTWKYQGEPAKSFYSLSCGSAMRLPNGNTLITESDSGRAFEVTHDGETVWKFVSPHRAGDRNQFVATLFELVRVPEAQLGWLPPRKP